MLRKIKVYIIVYYFYYCKPVFYKFYNERDIQLLKFAIAPDRVSIA